MAEDDQERTEPATSKRRTQAKEEGQVAKSNDINSAMCLLTGTLLLSYFGTYIWKNLHNIFIMSLSSLCLNDFSIREMHTRFIIIAIQFFKIILPFMIVLLVSAFLSNYIQIGFLISTKCIVPKLSRINPLEGFKKIFSKTAFIEFLKAFFKITIIGYLSFLVIKEVMNVILSLGDVDIKQMIESIGQIILKIGLKISVYLMILAIADYGYQRWMHEKNMRMTKQEIKDEMRDIEGNPVIKSRIRSIQRQAAMQRMMAEVPKADVVVTNPTHLAVALKYDSKTMNAPYVVAKGVRLIAERIKKVAKEHDVPIIENKPLARSLYKLCEIRKEIPIQLYRAVAEMLAYIYKLKGKSIN